MLLLTILSGILAYCAFRSGGVDAYDSSLAVFVLSGAAAAHYALRRQRGEPYPRVIVWTLVSVPVFAAFQLLPLPMFALHVLSPVRAALLEKAESVIGHSIRFASLSLAPRTGIQHVLCLTACIVLLFLVRELASVHTGRAWVVIAPVLVIAVLEAAYGWLQYFYLGAGEARGTWPNRNHFANFLAMCVPFPVAYAVAVLRRRPADQETAQVRLVSLACGALSISAFLLLAIMRSLSRMGFASALLALLVCGAALGYAKLREAEASRRARLAILGALPAAVLIALFVLAPPELVSRFTDLDFSDGITTQDRVLLWKESLPLISDYPVFGTGLGTYESAFLMHKTAFPLVRDEFAHNDYLQYLIELGVFGSLLVGAALCLVLFRTARAVTRSGPEGRPLAAACCGSFAAMLLHSIVDFNLYIPANALLLAWVAGCACALPTSPARAAGMLFPRVHVKGEEMSDGRLLPVLHREGLGRKRHERAHLVRPQTPDSKIAARITNADQEP